MSPESRSPRAGSSSGRWLRQSSLPKWKVFPSSHVRCRTVASFRATATILAASPRPGDPQAQAPSGEKVCVRLSACAASSSIAYNRLLNRQDVLSRTFGLTNDMTSSAGRRVVVGAAAEIAVEEEHRDGGATPVRGGVRSTMSKRSAFRYFKTSPEIIRLAVMLYVLFPLSLRNIADLLHERCIEVSHETGRFWWNRFRPAFQGRPPAGRADDGAISVAVSPPRRRRGTGVSDRQRA